MKVSLWSISAMTLLAVLAACAPIAPAAPAATQAPESTLAPALPLTDADVPRVSAADAKAALESGEAIIVDTRNADSYAAGHIPSALSIPLDQFEQDPAPLPLDKARWIITYCT